MNFKKLLYFKTIVEQGQISRAARVLHMSQPPLSQRLKELEDELGVTLIERAGNNWAVTTEGKALYMRALEILDLVYGIPDELQASKLGVEGLVTMGSTTLSLSLVSKFIPYLNNLHPQITIRLLFDDSTMLMHKLLEHVVDFCITITPATKSDLHIIPLHPTRSMLVIPRTFARTAFLRSAEDGAPLDIRELNGAPLVMFRRLDGGGMYSKTMEIFHQRGVFPHVLLDSPDGRILLHMLEEGLKAIALVPDSEIPARFRQSYLLCPLPEYFPSINPCLAIVEKRYLPRAAQTTWKELCNFISQRKLKT